MVISSYKLPTSSGNGTSLSFIRFSLSWRTEHPMSVDKSIFHRRRQRQGETFDFHTGEQTTTRWKSDEQIERYVPTHCCYCGVQCGMYLKVVHGQVVGVEPREDFPLNRGMLCPKGATAYQ